LKSKGLRFSGKPLGRPVKLSEEDVKLSTAKRRQHRAGSRLRNQIEGKFGKGQVFLCRFGKGWKYCFCW